MRYNGVTQGCTIEKQMLVPKKHLKVDAYAPRRER